MSINAAMSETLELELAVPRGEAQWFGGGGCVVEAEGLKHVFVKGTLVGSFGPKDTATRNLLMVSLSRGPQVHLERLAEAFDFSVDGLRRIRRLYEARGGAAVAARVNGGVRTTKLTARIRRKLEVAFDAGCTIDEARATLGKKETLSRSLVGEVRLDWKKAREAPPTLAVVPEPAESEAAATAGRHATSSGVALTVVATPNAQEGLDAPERLKSAAVGSASSVQHLGTWLLVAMVARLGLHQRAREVAAARRLSVESVRVALDAVVATLAVGETCVEGVRRLATSTGAELLRATGMPSPTWTRRALAELAADGGGLALHLGMAGDYLREAQAAASASGPVFYVDNHLRPYTGKQVLRRGWRMQDKRVKPGTSDYYVHDEDGRPVLRLAAPGHGSLTEWLSPIARMLRLALGREETILLAFDRAGAFPEQLAELREDGFEFVTYERRPYPDFADALFTESVTLEGEVLRFFDTRKNLGKERGRVRRVAVKLPDGHQLNLLANSKRSPVEMLEVMSGRWRQENGFKHGVERWGINQLDGRSVVAFPPDTIIPNPARRRLDRALRIARVAEGGARAALARLAADDPKRSALQLDIDSAVAEQSALEAQRPSTPPRAALRDTELSGKLVHHAIDYKLLLDSVRIACANAEAELAAMLAPMLPRPKEAKKVLANLFKAPGSIRLSRNAIHVCLDPAASRPELDALEGLIASFNRLKLSMPGDQHARLLRLSAPRK